MSCLDGAGAGAISERALADPLTWTPSCASFRPPGGWLLEPTTVHVVAPPRSGWEVVGDLTAEDLRTVATQGIAEITEGVPAGSGAQVVASMRQRVWARDSRTVPPVPSGAAFAAYALGFLTQESVRVSAHGRWTRLSTATGHVLVR